VKCVDLILMASTEMSNLMKIVNYVLMPCILLLSFLLGGAMSNAEEKYGHEALFNAQELSELEKQADNDDIEALRCLFEHYAEDYDKSVIVARKGAALGDAKFRYNLYVLLSVRNNPSHRQEGLKALRSAAEQGEVYAQSSLARLYERGAEGTQRDLSLAEKWYEKAALQGSVTSMVSVAHLKADRASNRSTLSDSYGWTLLFLKRTPVQKSQLVDRIRKVQGDILVKIKKLGVNEKVFIAEARARASKIDRKIPMNDPIGLIVTDCKRLRRNN